jgi:hypothetical protein
VCIYICMYTYTHRDTYICVCVHVCITLSYSVRLFCVEKGPAADSTDAPQPEGLLCDPYDEDEEKSG